MKRYLQTFEKFAMDVCKMTGSFLAFFVALYVVIIWAVSGPFFGFSEIWQNVFNAGITIVIILMLFLIQKHTLKIQSIFNVNLKKDVSLKSSHLWMKPSFTLNNQNIVLLKNTIALFKHQFSRINWRY